MSNKLSKAAKAVAHHSPGRTRLKVPKKHRHKLHELKSEIAKQPGVKNVDINHDTGSIVVQHEHDTAIFDAMHKAVEGLGGELLTALIEGESVEMLGVASVVAAGVGILEAVGKTFFGTREENSTPLLTGATSDIKTLVPAAFLLASIVKSYQTRSFWQGVAPIVLAYYAFDSYWKLNVSNPNLLDGQNGGGGGGNGKSKGHESERSA